MAFNTLPPEDFITAAEIPEAPIVVDNVLNNSNLGALSLSQNVTGYNNIAYGRAALQSNLDGVNNIALGRNTLSNNTSGYKNIAIGGDTLYSATTAYDNIGIGSAAGYYISGTDNVAIGTSSMFWNQNGYSNVAIGKQSLWNGWGSQNVAIGMYAGYYNQEGSGNVFIGYQAGMWAQYQSNKLYISNNNTYQPLIYGEFNNNYLKINGKLNLRDQPLSESVARNITISTSDPSGGSSGDIWLKYTA